MNPLRMHDHKVPKINHSVSGFFCTFTDSGCNFTRRDCWNLKIHNKERLESIFTFKMTERAKRGLCLKSAFLNRVQM